MLQNITSSANLVFDTAKRDDSVLGASVNKDDNEEDEIMDRPNAVGRVELPSCPCKLALF